MVEKLSLKQKKHPKSQQDKIEELQQQNENLKSLVQHLMETVESKDAKFCKFLPICFAIRCFTRCFVLSDTEFIYSVKIVVSDSSL